MRAFIGLLIFVASLWIIEIADTLGNFGLENYGILPRNVTGLRGIPLSVFLHADFNHLISNTAPLIVLGGLISMRGAKRLLASSVFITLVSGAFVWLMAGVVSGYGIHIGASGLVFGYFGYLAARGLYERSLNSISHFGCGNSLVRHHNLRHYSNGRIRVVGRASVRSDSGSSLCGACRERGAKTGCGRGFLSLNVSCPCFSRSRRAEQESGISGGRTPMIGYIAKRRVQLFLPCWRLWIAEWRAIRGSRFPSSRGQAWREMALVWHIQVDIVSASFSSSSESESDAANFSSCQFQFNRV